MRYASRTASTFQRVEPLPWTPYLDDCLEKLGEAADCETDALLAHMVRLQVISNKALGVTAPTAIPYDVYVETFLSELDRLQKSLPDRLKTNGTNTNLALFDAELTGMADVLRLHNLNTEISIRQLSLRSSHQTVPTNTNPNIQRTESLWACLDATKSWVTTFDSFPLDRYPKISLGTFGQIAHCMIVLLRLSIFESPEIPWDRRRIIEELNLGKVVKDWKDRFSDMPQAAGLDLDVGNDFDESIWSLLSRRQSAILEWWDTKVAPRLASIDESKGRGVEERADPDPMDVSAQQATDVIDITSEYMQSLDDDAWWKALMNLNDEYFGNSIF